MHESASPIKHKLISWLLFKIAKLLKKNVLLQTSLFMVEIFQQYVFLEAGIFKTSKDCSKPHSLNIRCQNSSLAVYFTHVHDNQIQDGLPFKVEVHGRTILFQF
jgi:hypothetical protein